MPRKSPNRLRHCASVPHLMSARCGWEDCPHLDNSSVRPCAPGAVHAGCVTQESQAQPSHLMEPQPRPCSGSQPGTVEPHRGVAVKSLQSGGLGPFAEPAQTRDTRPCCHAMRGGRCMSWPPSDRQRQQFRDQSQQGHRATLQTQAQLTCRLPCTKRSHVNLLGILGPAPHGQR